MRYIIIIIFFILSCSKPNKYSLTGNVNLNDDDKVLCYASAGSVDAIASILEDVT